VDDPAVLKLLDKVAPGVAVSDLGGGNGLNLLLGDDLVLRVHKPFISRTRLVGERELRQKLADQGLRVGVPAGDGLVRCGPRWAELERFVPTEYLEPDLAWLFAAIGRLHRVLATVPGGPVRPKIVTLASPQTLRRWLTTNRAAGHPGAVPELDPILRELAQRWIPTDRLPHQLVHGDPHPDNVLLSLDHKPLYLDFGSIMSAPRVFDLSYALAHVLIRLGQPRDEIPTAVRAYEESAGWRLTAPERAALIPYAASVPLYYDICDWGDGGPFRDVSTWLLRLPAQLLVKARPSETRSIRR
jgi:Ser/Thr protein kinase RdoA (MazF antagonist)